jgi:hypothetical protein
VDELHTSDEGASNVNPRVRNLVTFRVMYYTFCTTRTRLFLRPERSPQNFKKKIFLRLTDTTEMHYFSKWFRCIGIVFEICQQYILRKGFFLRPLLRDTYTILAPGFIVLELSSKYANSTISEKEF